jgi:REP element-mobilizing transposase RayT
MTYDPNIHHRRSIRLRGYDYSQAGAYFVTICTRDRERLFGYIVNGALQPNSYAGIVVEWWNSIPEHFPSVELDASVVMPNHMHGIVVLATPTSTSAQPPTLGRVIAYFKYQSTKDVNQRRPPLGNAVWQRNYYEHIIRDQESLRRIREYIVNNPQQWELDQLNPDHRSKK